MRCGELRELLAGEASGEALVLWGDDDASEATGAGSVRGLVAVREVEGAEEVRLVVDDPRGAPMTVEELRAWFDRLDPAPEQEVTVAVRGSDGMAVHPVVDLDVLQVRYVGPSPEVVGAAQSQPRTARALVLSALLVLSAAVTGLAATSRATERVAPEIEDDGGRGTVTVSAVVQSSTTVEVPSDSPSPDPAPTAAPAQPVAVEAASEEAGPVPGTAQEQETREIRRLPWPAIFFPPPEVERPPAPRGGVTSPPTTVRRRPTTTGRVRPSTSVATTAVPPSTAPPVTDPPPTEPPATEPPATTEPPVTTEPPAPDPPPGEDDIV